MLDPGAEHAAAARKKKHRRSPVSPSAAVVAE
jgi:hypothetical protein